MPLSLSHLRAPPPWLRCEGAGGGGSFSSVAIVRAGEKERERAKSAQKKAARVEEEKKKVRKRESSIASTSFLLLFSLFLLACRCPSSPRPASPLLAQTHIACISIEMLHNHPSSPSFFQRLEERPLLGTTSNSLSGGSELQQLPSSSLAPAVAVAIANASAALSPTKRGSSKGPRCPRP